MSDPTPTEATLRAFVAVRPPDEVRRAVAEAAAGLRRADRSLARGLRFVHEDRLHLTLAFLGELPRERSDELIDATRAVAATHAPFELALDGLGGFPRRGAARVAWLDLASGRDDLEALADALRMRLTSDELPFDRKPFRPHLTLARARARPVVLPERFDVPASTFRVTELEVVRSRLGSQGASHETMARCPLRLASR